MSATDTQQSAENAAENATSQDHLLTDEERAALTLELGADEGEGAASPDDDEDGAQGAQGEQPTGTAAQPGQEGKPADKAQTKPGEPASGTDTAAGQDTKAQTEAATQAKPNADTKTDANAPAQAQATPPADAQTKPAVPATDGTAPAQLPGAGPRFSYELPADHNERVAALEGKFLALDQRLEAGEIDQGDYNKAFRQLAVEQGQLQAQASRAEIAKEMREQEQARLAEQERADWTNASYALFAQTKGKPGAPDYAGNEVAAKALGKQVEALMVERGLDPALPVSGKLELLRQAHRVLVFMQTGKAPDEAAAAPPVDTQAAVKQAADARKPDLSKAAKSIASIPAADNGPEGGEFADLDKLKGEKLEAALAVLANRDPAAYERYLNV